MINNQTICAIATAQGSGAIAVIRLSGSDSYKVLGKIFFPKSHKDINALKANTIHFGNIQDGHKIIDEVLVSLFRAPHSYTGEDSIEISCHGSSYIQQTILNLLIRNGARLATPGEFTLRSFLNGKMDLSQAEAVADLIASTSAATQRVAMQQMRGGFSSEISNLRTDLLNFISLIELELDFSEEDVEFADRTALNQLVSDISKLLSQLLNSFELGNVIKNGVPVAIIGEPNVGKSTLLNKLLNEERAIVTHIAGTTRDVIEDTVVINGLTFRFIDTAGIRETTDEIESIGIGRTYEKIAQASVVLLVVDAAQDKADIQKKLLEIKEKASVSKKIILVVNKIDTLNFAFDASEIDADEIIEISAKHNQNIDILTQILTDTINLSELKDDDVIVTNSRHFEALNSAKEAIERVKLGISAGISSDFIAQDIRESLHYLGLITGQITDDEILGNIFSKFCIGK